MKIAFVYLNNVRNIGVGAGYVFASIPERHEKVFFDTTYIRNNQLVNFIVNGNFDILMISTMTLFFPDAIEIIQAVKEKTNIPVLLGGIHAMIMKGKLLKDYPEIDYLCIGEGEKFIKQFLSLYGTEGLYLIDDLAYRKDGKIIENERGLVFELRLLPSFPWNIFHRVVNEKGWIYVHATRGCPYKCTYCLPKETKILMNDLSWKNIEKVKRNDEIIGIQKQRYRNYFVNGKVTETFKRKSKLLEIKTEKEILQATPEHVLLTSHNRWREAKQLKIGQNLRRPFVPIKNTPETENYKYGYITGALEGDGYVSINKTKRPYGKKIYDAYIVRLACKDKEIMETTLKYIVEAGYECHKIPFHDKTIKWAICSYRKETYKWYQKIRKIDNEEFRSGYLAGIFDAEGSWTSALRIHNYDRNIKNKVSDYLENFHFQPKIEKKAVTILGGRKEYIRFFSLTQPKIKRKQQRLYDLTLNSKVKVMDIKPIKKEIDVYNIETTINNYIANGFVVHNCCNELYLETYGTSYLRTRTINHVIDELQRLKEKYNPKMFYFGDEMILFSNAYAIELFKEIKKYVGIPYGFMARPERIKPDLMPTLRDTGCIYIGMGVECGDEGFRKEHLNRHMSNQKIINAFYFCREFGIETCSFNMIGWPFGYDDQLCISTIELNKVIRPNTMQVTWFYPFPGTKLYDYCIENNLIQKGMTLRSYHHGSILKMHKGKPTSASEYLKGIK